MKLTRHTYTIKESKIERKVFYPNFKISKSICLFNELWIDIDNSNIKIENKTHHAFVYRSEKSGNYHLKLCYKNTFYLPGLVPDILDFADELNLDFSREINNVFHILYWLVNQQGFINSFFVYEMLEKLQQYYNGYYDADRCISLRHTISQLFYKPLQKKVFKRFNVMDDFLDKVCGGSLSSFYSHISDFAITHARRYETLVPAFISVRKVKVKKHLHSKSRLVSYSQRIEVFKQIVQLFKKIWLPGHRQTLALFLNSLLYYYVEREKSKRQQLFQILVVDEIESVDEEYEKRLDVVIYENGYFANNETIFSYLENHFGNDVVNQLRKLIEKFYTRDVEVVEEEKEFVYKLWAGNQRQKSIALQTIHFVFGLFFDYLLHKDKFGKRISLTKKQISNYVRFGAQVNGFDLSEKYAITQPLKLIDSLCKTGWFKFIGRKGREYVLEVDWERLTFDMFAFLKYNPEIKKFVVLKLYKPFERRKQFISPDHNIFQFIAFIFKCLAVADEDTQKFFYANMNFRDSNFDPCKALDTLSEMAKKRIEKDNKSFNRLMFKIKTLHNKRGMYAPHKWSVGFFENYRISNEFGLAPRSLSFVSMKKMLKVIVFQTFLPLVGIKPNELLDLWKRFIASINCNVDKEDRCKKVKQKILEKEELEWHDFPTIIRHIDNLQKVKEIIETNLETFRFLYRNEFYSKQLCF